MERNYLIFILPFSPDQYGHYYLPDRQPFSALCRFLLLAGSHFTPASDSWLYASHSFSADSSSPASPKQ